MCEDDVCDFESDDADKRVDTVSGVLNAPFASVLAAVKGYANTLIAEQAENDTKLFSCVVSYDLSESVENMRPTRIAWSDCASDGVYYIEADEDNKDACIVDYLDGVAENWLVEEHLPPILLDAIATFAYGPSGSYRYSEFVTGSLKGGDLIKKYLRIIQNAPENPED